MVLPTTRRGVSGLLALLGIRPAVAAPTSAPAPSVSPDASLAILLEHIGELHGMVEYLLWARLQDRYGPAALLAACPPIANLDMDEVRGGVPLAEGMGERDRQQLEQFVQSMEARTCELTDLQDRVERAEGFGLRPAVRSR